MHLPPPPSTGSRRRISSLRRAALAAASWLLAAGTAAAAEPVSWEPVGWGGGGFYFGAAFHPAKDGVVYLGGNVAGFYKSEDHGRNWRFSNQGLTHYVIHSLAVSPAHPDTVYASTVGGLHKSTDSGETWRFIPRTGKADLRLTGERDLGIQPVAADPSDASIVYAASPGGAIYKSTDGAETWQAVYRPAGEAAPDDALRVQFGRVNGAAFGGFWLPLAFPAGLKPEDCSGLVLSLAPGENPPAKATLTVTTRDGVAYASKDLGGRLAAGAPQELLLTAADFSVADSFKRKHPDKAQTVPPAPAWDQVVRMDFAVSGALANTSHVLLIKGVHFAALRAPDGRTGTAQRPVLLAAHDFAADKNLRTYGNIRVGAAAAGSIYSVAVAAGRPSLVAAASADEGVLLSEDAGRTWRSLDTPRRASTVSFAPGDPDVIYASFWTDGVRKSTDQGRTWTDITGDFGKNFSVRQVLASPLDPQTVYVVGAAGWNGAFFLSHDGGKTWTRRTTMTASPYNPTITGSSLAKEVPMSKPTNLAVNPLNPRQLFISANWRPCMSEDGGLTWTERDHGADISVVTDIRFSGARTYVTAMDEGAFVSEDGGRNWRQLWPLKYSGDFTGHAWRIAVDNLGGEDRIIATQTPWDPKHPNRIVVSEDGGKTHAVVTAGLPDYTPRKNVMWDRGYPRALAVDPNNPRIAYLGIDGDAEDGKTGGGIFKTEDGGRSWKQLPNQPGSRRMFYGLAIDPTDSKRLFWGACATKGGLYRSEDAGATWQHVFTKESWVFNVLVTKTGEIYCGGKNLWRSIDHGATWTRLTQFDPKLSVVGIEADPRDPKTLWISTTTWDGSVAGGVYKTTDHGATWVDITGNLDYKKPILLRFNPQTNELWCGGVPLYKTRQ